MAVLDGRRALVTGASAGIGAATARALALAGAQVACLARRRERVEALAHELGGVAVTADIARHDEAVRAVGEAAAALGGLDLLVNNAGVMRPGPVGAGSYSDWREMFDVNVLGLLSVTQAALGHLRARAPADLVNISSMSGRRVPSASGGVYSATKHAVHAVSQGLRRELHGTGVRVSVVSPGFVDTDMGSDVADPEVRERIARNQAELGLDPGVIARAVVRLVSEPPEVNTFEVAILPAAQES